MTWSYIFQEMYKDYWIHISEVEMTLTGLILLLLIAGIVGAIGQSLSGYSFGGCLWSRSSLVLLGLTSVYVGWAAWTS
jgi:hypothetical protein